MIETLVAMAITIVVMLANLYLFNTAQKDLAFSRALTTATNLATAKIDEFKALTIAQIKAAAPDVLGAPNPLDVRRGSDMLSGDGMPFSRTWTISDVDLENAAVNPVPELAGDLVKIKLEVAWSVADKVHHVTMTTFTTGKAP